MYKLNYIKNIADNILESIDLNIVQLTCLPVCVVVIYWK